MQPGWCQPVRQEFMQNECEALPGVAYPGVRDNRSTINTKTGYDDDDDNTVTQKQFLFIFPFLQTNITSQMWPTGGGGGVISTDRHTPIHYF